MEIGCMWMRRAGTNCLVIMKNKPMTPTRSYVSYLKTHLVPVSSLPSFHLGPIFVTKTALYCSSSCSSPALIPADDSLDCSNTSEIGGRSSKVVLKGMRYSELEKWVQSHGYRPGQALMLWKRLYGDNIWAHCSDELEGLNKNFKKMLSELAEFKALTLKDIRTASDGTRKEVADAIHFG